MSWRNPRLRCHQRVSRRCDRSLWMQVLFLRVVALALVVGIPAPGVCAAQQSAQWYGGGLIGVSTLSADAQTVTSSVGFSVALYKPENGLATNWFVGTHLTDHVTLQANYIWNRNGLTVLSSRATAGGIALSEQLRGSTQHAVVGDFLLYFRSRGDRFRPYLSLGGGIVRLSSTRTEDPLLIETQPPDQRFSAVHPTMRVAVGLDVMAGRTWLLRYSFSESLSANPVSAQLSPEGERNLANFQNLIGLVRLF